MLPSEMNLNVRFGTIEYNNKILVSDSQCFSTYGVCPQVESYHTYCSFPQVCSHPIQHTEDQWVTLVLALASAFGIWYAFR